VEDGSGARAASTAAVVEGGQHGQSPPLAGPARARRTEAVNPTGLIVLKRIVMGYIVSSLMGLQHMDCTVA
jgi:hypothetical protein